MGKRSKKKNNENKQEFLDSGSIRRAGIPAGQGVRGGLWHPSLWFSTRVPKHPETSRSGPLMRCCSWGWWCPHAPGASCRSPAVLKPGRRSSPTSDGSSSGQRIRALDIRRCSRHIAVSGRGRRSDFQSSQTCSLTPT